MNYCDLFNNQQQSHVFERLLEVVFVLDFLFLLGYGPENTIYQSFHIYLHIFFPNTLWLYHLCVESGPTWPFFPSSKKIRICKLESNKNYQPLAIWVQAVFKLDGTWRIVKSIRVIQKTLEDKKFFTSQNDFSSCLWKHFLTWAI